MDAWWLIICVVVIVVIIAVILLYLHDDPVVADNVAVEETYRFHGADENRVFSLVLPRACNC